MKSCGSSDSSPWVSDATRWWIRLGVINSNSRPPTSSAAPSTPLPMIPISKRRSNQFLGLNNFATLRLGPAVPVLRSCGSVANVTREGGCGKYGCLSGQRDREPGKESTQVERDLNRVNTPIDHRGVKAEQEAAHC